MERIRSAEKLGEKFEYPDSYSLEKYTDGTFGIMDGPVTEVELHVLNPETVAYLKSRRLHRHRGSLSVTFASKAVAALPP